MKAGIITTPDRQEYLPQLVKLISPQVDVLKIFNDEKKQGHTYNLSRCMEDMLDNAQNGEPILIMCDDVTTVPDWKARFLDLHYKANGEIYCFMNRRRHLFTEENKARGYVKGIFPGAYYDHATVFINQQGLIGRIRKWQAEVGNELLGEKFAKHFDNVIQEYFVRNKQEWVVTTPTLFDHVGEVSALGHSIGGSPDYIGKI